MSLAPDDFTPGMFVTVLDTSVERPHPFAHAAGKETFEMKSYTGAGVVLEVVSTSFPFVLVRNHTRRMMPSPRVFPVDLRRTRLARLSDDYVREAVSAQASHARLDATTEHQSGFPVTMRITGPFIDEIIDASRRQSDPPPHADTDTNTDNHE
ncbi:MAG: hypothetical protein ACF8GE_06140 [Phycisphaerales bacterium JB043]